MVEVNLHNQIIELIMARIINKNENLLQLNIRVQNTKNRFCWNVEIILRLWEGSKIKTPKCFLTFRGFYFIFYFDSGFLY